MRPTQELEQALLQQHPTEKKMRLISANSRLFTPIEMRLSTLIRECSAIIFRTHRIRILINRFKSPNYFIYRSQANHLPFYTKE